MQNNWIYSPYAEYAYTVRNKDFLITYDNSGFELLQLVDKNQVLGNSGKATIGYISVTTSFKVFEETNYINIIHSVTNNGNIAKSVNIGLHSDIAIEGRDGSNGDHCPTKNIDGNRGVEFINGDRTVRFLLRDFHFVTSVDTYSYARCEPYGYWVNCSNYNYVTYGAGIHFSWQNIIINPHETKNYSYSIGMGDYKPKNTSNSIKSTLINDPIFLFKQRVPGFRRKR